MESWRDSLETSQPGTLMLTDSESQPLFMLLVLLAKVTGTPKKKYNHTDVICGTDGRTYSSINEFKNSLFRNPRLRITKLSLCNEENFQLPIDEGMSNSGVEYNNSNKQNLTKQDHKVLPKGKEQVDDVVEFNKPYRRPSSYGKDLFYEIPNIKPYEKPKFKDYGLDSIKHLPKNALSDLINKQIMPKTKKLVSAKPKEFDYYLNHWNATKKSDQGPKYTDYGWNSKDVLDNIKYLTNIDLDPKGSHSINKLNSWPKTKELISAESKEIGSDLNNWDAIKKSDQGPKYTEYGLNSKDVLDNIKYLADIGFYSKSKHSFNQPNPRPKPAESLLVESNDIGFDLHNWDAAKKTNQGPKYSEYGLNRKDVLDNIKYLANMGFEPKGSLSKLNPRPKTKELVSAESNEIGFDLNNWDVIKKSDQGPKYTEYGLNSKYPINVVPIIKPYGGQEYKRYDLYNSKYPGNIGFDSKSRDLNQESKIKKLVSDDGEFKEIGSNNWNINNHKVFRGDKI